MYYLALTRGAATALIGRLLRGLTLLQHHLSLSCDPAFAGLFSATFNL